MVWKVLHYNRYLKVQWCYKLVKVNIPTEERAVKIDTNENTTIILEHNTEYRRDIIDNLIKIWNVTAKNLVFVTASGILDGDISTKKVVLEPGCKFSGKCTMISE